MNQEQVWRWLDALKSGKYTQLQGGFYDSDKHCCLAVQSDALGFRYPDGTVKFVGYGNEREEVLYDSQQFHACVTLNDHGPEDQYARVIASIESEPEFYITKV